MFQRVFSQPAQKQDSATPGTKASWTPLMSAADSTRVVITPYISNPAVTPGAKKTYGGGNAYLVGLLRLFGTEPTTMGDRSRFDSLPQV